MSRDLSTRVIKRGGFRLLQKPTDSYVYVVKKLVLSNSVGDWCRIPYEDHPKGCPKYNKSPICPPKAPKLEYFFDMEKPFLLVHSEFDLAAYVEKRRKKFPSHSERQLRNVLYWQDISRGQLINRITEMEGPSKVIFSMCPEGMGVNVYATARLSGLNLEKMCNLKTCRHVALVQFC